MFILCKWIRFRNYLRRLLSSTRMPCSFSIHATTNNNAKNMKAMCFNFRMAFAVQPHSSHNIELFQNVHYIVRIHAVCAPFDLWASLHLRITLSSSRIFNCHSEKSCSSCKYLRNLFQQLQDFSLKFDGRRGKSFARSDWVNSTSHFRLSDECSARND